MKRHILLLIILSSKLFSSCVEQYRLAQQLAPDTCYIFNLILMNANFEDFQKYIHLINHNNKILYIQHRINAYKECIQILLQKEFELDSDDWAILNPRVLCTLNINDIKVTRIRNLLQIAHLDDLVSITQQISEKIPWDLHKTIKQYIGWKYTDEQNISYNAILREYLNIYDSMGAVLEQHKSNKNLHDPINATDSQEAIDILSPACRIL